MFKIKIFFLFLLVVILCGCSKYGTYNNKDSNEFNYVEIEIIKPNFFNYIESNLLDPQFISGKFISYGNKIFIELDEEEETGLYVYFTDFMYKKVDIGTDEWRTTLYRVK
jgi:hypothetical protein